MRFDGRNLVGLDDGEFSKIRGKRIGFIFQDPARSLNPVMRVGRQVSEAIRLHTDIKGRAVTDKVVELLEQVHLPDPAALLRRYPHQLSGGQQQRVMIAAAIAADPELLIADEPTTALDVTVQHEILRLLISLTEQREMSVLFVSHDLGVVRYVCDRVAVVYGGQVVEIRAHRRRRPAPAAPVHHGAARREPGDAEGRRLWILHRTAAADDRRVRPGDRALPQRMSFPQPLRARDGLVRRDPSAGDER